MFRLFDFHLYTILLKGPIGIELLLDIVTLTKLNKFLVFPELKSILKLHYSV